HLVFGLPNPRPVLAIRICCTYESDLTVPILFQAFWRGPGEGFVETERNFTTRFRGEQREKTVTIPVNDTIEEFPIDPDTRPCLVRIRSIHLLVKGRASPRKGGADEHR